MRNVLIATLIVGVGALTAACTSNSPAPTFPAPAGAAQPASLAPPPAPAPAPAAPAPQSSAAGADILASSCTSCHGADTVTSERHDRDGWKAVINDMIGSGASITDADANQLATYLAANYGVTPAR